MKKSVRITLAVVIGTLLTGLAYYLLLPAINVHNKGFWAFLILVALFYTVPLGFRPLRLIEEKTAKKKPARRDGFEKGVNIAALSVVGAALAVLIIGGIISSRFFNARQYASVIEVKESEFSADMPEADKVSNISLMDTASASIIGNRALGSLSDVVSQYQLNGTYNQINYKGTPKKVDQLEYVDFFRWLNNRNKGVPGYVMVDPVNNTAEYVRFDKPLTYVDSGWFNDDLMRKLHFSYPTKIFNAANFELDEEGRPWFIVPCLKPHVGLFGAMDVSEVIIFDPVDGTSTIYPVAEVPSWVDNVFDGYLASDKYDWYGILSGGWWNSVLGKTGCKQCTDDFGYIVIGDDVWYFTGVTSVSGDESNIGFIITNARTGEYRYYPVVGAEEYSAMHAAEGEVQEKGYVASFPSLINVSGQATYIMVLKDNGGLVKLYALVNVEKYSIVATGTTQEAAKEAYLELLVREGLISESDIPGTDDPAAETETASVTVTDVRLAVMDGETIVYVTADDGCVYRGRLSADESLILLSAGQSVTFTYTATDHPAIRAIAGWQ